MADDLLTTIVQEWAKPLGQIIGGPAAGALTGWLLGRKARGKVEKDAEAKASADQTDAITRRFNMLMDGYEERVKDLTHEIAVLREEMASVHRQTSQRSASVDRLMNNMQELDYGEDANSEADRSRAQQTPQG